MDRDLEGKRAMSLRLSKVLGDIGVNREMIIWRRQTWLTIGKLATVVCSTLLDTKVDYFYFGSQSEGTTTLGMQSDIDAFYSSYDTHIMLEMSQWEPGRILNLLVLKNGHSPPQHCSLQVLRSDRPLPETLNRVTEEMKSVIEVDMEGRLLLKNTRTDRIIKTILGKEYIKKGPSRSMSKDHDIVEAYSCIRSPDECMFLFRRPRPGHWPRSAVLSKARQTQTYLVPQGHAESCYNTLDWRFSTPHIERLLMFDLNMIKIKVYTFLKILRKTYFKPVFDDRLSTYHMKTAMMFSLESYPYDIWKSNNLLQCVIYCLTTLERWCRMHYCPHYTIDGVDLFVGKLKNFELLRISGMLADMKENISNYVIDVQMDQLGERMLTGTKLPFVSLLPRSEYTQIIYRFCLEKLLMHIHEFSSALRNENQDSASQLIIKCRHLVSACHAFLNDTKHEFTRDACLLLIDYINNILVSVQVSVCIEFLQNNTEEINDQYQVSMDVSSGRLKFASLLYCTGRYERSAALLENTEELLHQNVWQFSLRGEDVNFGPNRTFLMKTLDLRISKVVKTSVALSINFFRHELNCLPKRLKYEMYRTFTLADAQQRKYGDTYMDNAFIESFPYLYYLQYLTFRELGQHDKKCAAVNKLAVYLEDKRNRCGYIETAYNILGHCYELENRLDLALKCYSCSLKMFPCNNAARWHMAIIITKLIKALKALKDCR